MLALEITINGRKRIVAATTSNRVLAVGLTWTHGDGEHLRLNIGGITDDADNYFKWNVPELTLGDEITIRIVETDSPDEPDRIYNPAIT